MLLFNSYFYSMSNRKVMTSFSPSQIKAWEDGDCVNFAVALARLTGWLLHVDWGAHSLDRDLPVSEMVSLRVYVGDNHDNIYDVRGKRKIKGFTETFIKPRVRQLGLMTSAINSRYYSEEKLWTLPLRVRPDEARIINSMEIIKNNTDFLQKIPQRIKPLIPAHLAADFTFGNCVVYAAALEDLTGLAATAISALEYNELFHGNKLDFVHAFNLHPDGLAEDAWGVQPLHYIAERFGMVKYTLSESEFRRINEKVKLTSADVYEKWYAKAVELIKQYR